MRVRHKPWAKEMLQEHSDVVIPNPAEQKGSWQHLFENKNAPIHVEVGSGKGQFIIGMAQKFPDINFIGIEREASIIVSILQKHLAAPLTNLKLLHENASDLTEIFSENEIDGLYLNFSDPWPKNRHEKRRLTFKTFLKQYNHVLTDDGELHFKTDNRGLFEYSLESFSRYGMLVKNISLDLHAAPCEWNVPTEYEEKFNEKGQPIYRCEALFR